MGLRDALCALLLRGPAHGYELLTTLEAELGDLWEARTSNIYLTLGKLEREGLISSQKVEQLARPAREVLTLTGRGHEAARRWLFEASDREDVVVRLAVARIVAPDQFREIAARWLEERTSTLATLRDLRKSARGGFRREAVEAEIGRVQGEVRWASQVVERAAEIVAAPPGDRRTRVTQQASDA